MTQIKSTYRIKIFTIPAYPTGYHYEVVDVKGTDLVNAFNNWYKKNKAAYGNDINGFMPTDEKIDSDFK
jgi:hypothetical protein